jgi:hypothetical protein
MEPTVTTKNVSLNIGDWRSRLAAKLDLPAVQHTLIALIVINAIILGMETSPSLFSSPCCQLPGLWLSCGRYAYFGCCD